MKLAIKSGFFIGNGGCFTYEIGVKGKQWQKKKKKNWTKKKKKKKKKAQKNHKTTPFSANFDPNPTKLAPKDAQCPCESIDTLYYAPHQIPRPARHHMSFTIHSKNITNDKMHKNPPKHPFLDQFSSTSNETTTKRRAISARTRKYPIPLNAESTAPSPTPPANR
jgi:hypothetical protein